MNSSRPAYGRSGLTSPIAGFSSMNVQSIDEVIEWASRFAVLIGDVGIEIRPLY